MLEFIGHLGEHEDIAGPTLHVAADKGDAACIRLLLEAGASPDVRTVPEDGTPLMKAAFSDNLEATEWLLDAGADIEATFHGVTAVLIAAFRSSTRVLQLLISRGANIDVVDEQDFTPLRAAIHNNDTASTGVLLQHSVCLNTALGDHKDTALHLAVHYGNPAIVRMLLDKGAYVDPAEADGDTPLQWAVHKGDIDLVKTLLSHGADIDRKNPYTGEVVLGWAVKCGHLSVTKYLISHGADRSLVDLDTIQKDPTADEQGFITCKALVESGSCSSVQDGTDEASPHIRPSPPASVSSPDKISANSPVDKETSALSAGDPGFLQSHDRVERRGRSDIPSRIGDIVKEVVSLQKIHDTVNLEANIDWHGTNGASQVRFKLIEIGPHQEFERLVSSLSYAVEHSGVTCNGEQCKSASRPIRGTRYKCASCEDIDFCSTCAASFFNKHSAHHAMIRVLLPAELYRILEIDEDTRKQLLAQYNDPEISTLVHAPKLEANPDWLPGTPEALPGESLAAKEAFFIASLNRKFFVTRRGYMGIGPKDMQPDDEIHVLSGTSVPFVMRKVTGEEDASTVNMVAEDGLALYRMIGECYVHGIMQGEATRREDAEWDGICIC